MAAEKHEDCKYYEEIDAKTGYCKRYPPIAKNDGREEYVIVTDTENACGEFVAEA